MRKTALVLFLAGALAAFAGVADERHHAPAGTSAEKPGSLADGEVRKVDKDARKITLRHGPLPQLDMPAAMTMVYQVKDPAMLERVKAGDKVKFEAENAGGAFVLVRIEPAR